LFASELDDYWLGGRGVDEFCSALYVITSFAGNTLNKSAVLAHRQSAAMAENCCQSKMAEYFLLN